MIAFDFFFLSRLQMAIKKYRVAHGLESVILGVLICAGLAIMYASGEKPNMTKNKEIVHLNKIFQDKIQEDERKREELKTTSVFNGFRESVGSKYSDEINEIIQTARQLESQIQALTTKCNKDMNGACLKKVDEMITLLGITSLG